MILLFVTLFAVGGGAWWESTHYYMSDPRRFRWQLLCVACWTVAAIVGVLTIIG